MFRVAVENLAKDYRIYRRPVDRLLEAVTRRPRHALATSLDGVSFSLAAGESLGVVGDNGAGKSTLLKLLAGTITPSRGRVVVYGRVAALLELGAGFHPEFTGRQNILLNASLLGMRQDDILKQEDKIIEFSGLGEFIDRPVKTYSSGMAVRLAFAVATSVDPDILVIDEALAVGDMAFQRKCIDRMGAFRERGKTMIFCSHSMYHVLELCDRALWLDKGRPRRLGPAADVVAGYEAHAEAAQKAGRDAEGRVGRGQGSPPGECRIRSLRMETPDGLCVESLFPFMDLVLKMEVDVLKDGAEPQFGFALVEPDETITAAAMTHHDGFRCGPYAAGQRLEVSLEIRDFPLRAGTYRLTGAVADKWGLLWYEPKNLWPVRVEGREGLGPVTLRREWRIREDGAAGGDHSR